jgi:hypothetical protein
MFIKEERGIVLIDVEHIEDGRELREVGGVLV